MKNKRIIPVIAAAAAVFAAGIIGCFAVLCQAHGSVVVLKQDGEIIYRLDLSKEKDRVFDIEYEGRTNTIEIKDGKLRVIAADCPDKVCVNTGELSAIPIICVPNRLEIRFAEGADYDAAAA